MASTLDNKTYHPTPKICHDVALMFDHETNAAKDFCSAFASMLLCADYCSNFCLTVVDSEEPCHPKIDADGDGVVDGKEEGVRHQKDKGSPVLIFVAIFALFAWASYHGSRNARSSSRTNNSPYDARPQWSQTGKCDRDDSAEQGIAMVDYYQDRNTQNGSLMPRDYQRSSDHRGAYL